MNDLMWKLLAGLLQRYQSTADGFALMQQYYPKNKRLQQIAAALKEGKTIDAILNTDRKEKRIAFYSQSMSLAKAIDLQLSNNQCKEKLMKLLLSRCAYPMALLGLSFLVLTLYQRLVLPTMSDSLQLNVSETVSIVNALTILSYGKNIVLVLFLVILLIASYIVAMKKETQCWMFLHCLNLDKLFGRIVTLTFSNDLKNLLENGLSLDGALRVLCCDQEKRCSQMLAQQFQNELENGVDFETALHNDYFDKAFYPLCVYGISNDDFIRSLTDYNEFAAQVLEIDLKRFSNGFTAFSIMMVCIVIVLCYRVMMIPLQLLEELV